MFTNQMSRSQREGKVVGTLVLTTCIMLGIVWLLGHLLVAFNPGGVAIAGESTVVSSDDDTLVADNSANNSPDASEDSDSQSFGRTDTPSDTSDVGEQSAPSRGIRDTTAGLANNHDFSTSSPTDPSNRFSTDTNASMEQGSRFQNDPSETGSSFESSQNRFASDAADPQGLNIDDVAEPNTEVDVTDELADLDSELPAESKVTFSPPIEEPNAPAVPPIAESPIVEAEDPLGLTGGSTDSLGLDTTTSNFDTVGGSSDPISQGSGENSVVESVSPVTDELANTATPQTTVSKPVVPAVMAEPKIEMKPTPQPKSPNLVDLTRRTPRAGRPLSTSGSQGSANRLQSKTQQRNATYPVRTWTSVDGKQVQARYERQDAKNAILRVGDKRFRVPFTRLSKRDLEHLRVIRQTDTSK